LLAQHDDDILIDLDLISSLSQGDLFDLHGLKGIRIIRCIVRVPKFCSVFISSEFVWYRVNMLASIGHNTSVPLESSRERK